MWVWKMTKTRFWKLFYFSSIYDGFFSNDFLSKLPKFFLALTDFSIKGLICMILKTYTCIILVSFLKIIPYEKYSKICPSLGIRGSKWSRNKPYNCVKHFTLSKKILYLHLSKCSFVQLSYVSGLRLYHFVLVTQLSF